MIYALWSLEAFRILAVGQRPHLDGGTTDGGASAPSVCWNSQYPIYGRVMQSPIWDTKWRRHQHTASRWKSKAPLIWQQGKAFAQLVRRQADMLPYRLSVAIRITS